MYDRYWTPAKMDFHVAGIEEALDRAFQPRAIYEE